MSSPSTESPPLAMGLSLRDAALEIAGRLLFAPLSCDVTAERPLALMGPSGSGKSSLLDWLIGSLPAGFVSAGRAYLDGTDLAGLPPEKRRIGILFQDDLLFPHLSVGENLAFALPPGLAREQRRARIAAALDEAELPGIEDRDPAGLSGGERARIALMRALLAEPKALLLDEPFAKLDLPLRARFRRLVFEKARARGLPILLVSHDPADAEALEGQVLNLGSGF